MSAMRFMSVRELQKSVGAIKDALSNDGKIVLTVAGKPAAVVIPTNENEFEETLVMLNQLKLAKAINDIREYAAQNGLQDMTMEEIDAEIAQYREEKRDQALQGVER